jgi:tetratricopeptide (TPR) repeat protein
MKGEVDMGLAELESVRTSDNIFALESDLLYVLAQGFILQKADEAMIEMQKLLKEYPKSRLVNYLGAAIAIKNSQSEEAISLLNNLEKLEKESPFAYAYYLKGEAYLNKGDYTNSIAAYRFFISHYAGLNYIKDAHYKIGLCYLLNGNESDALALFKKAKSEGVEETEADKYAARSIAEDELPNITLSKIRYLTDGGYYNQAQQILDSIRSPQIPTKRDHVEYYYRKARLAHKRGELEIAEKNYRDVIKTNESSPWYYAPNACLQLGYIYMEKKNYTLARDYFENAREYKKHEYKNSIDGKAKAALDHLSKLK